MMIILAVQEWKAELLSKFLRLEPDGLTESQVLVILYLLKMYGDRVQLWKQNNECVNTLAGAGSWFASGAEPAVDAIEYSLRLAVTPSVLLIQLNPDDLSEVFRDVTGSRRCKSETDFDAILRALDERQRERLLCAATERQGSVAFTMILWWFLPFFLVFISRSTRTRRFVRSFVQFLRLPRRFRRLIHDKHDSCNMYQSVFCFLMSSLWFLLFVNTIFLYWNILSPPQIIGYVSGTECGVILGQWLIIGLLLPLYFNAEDNSIDDVRSLLLHSKEWDSHVFDVTDKTTSVSIATASALASSDAASSSSSSCSPAGALGTSAVIFTRNTLDEVSKRSSSLVLIRHPYV